MKVEHVKGDVQRTPRYLISDTLLAAKIVRLGMLH